MPDSLWELLDSDREAYAFFQSLPMFAQDQIKMHADRVRSKEDISALAHNIARGALMMEPYKPMFEDETDSKIDLI